MNPYTSRRRPARLIAFFTTVLLGLTAVGLAPPAQATTAGTPDTAFNAQFLPAPILGNTVNTTVVASDGSVFVGGRFTGGLKKLNADGSLNTAFNTNVANSLFGCEVNSIALTAGGEPIVGCGYNTDNVYLSKFNTNGTIDSTFAANVRATADGDVFDVVVSNSGEIYAGGILSGHLKKFSINGTPAAAFNGAVGSSLDNYVMDLLEMPDGSILAAGDFTGKIKKFNSDGTTTAPAAAFNTSVTGAILFQARALALTTDGSILVGTQGGANLYKINSDGTSTGTAATFNTNIGLSLTDFVDAIQVLSDGSIVIGGRFPDRLKKLNSDGSTTGTAATFNRGAAGFLLGDVNAIALGSSDRLYVGGNFGEKLISFNADGSRTGATGSFNAIVSHQPVGELEVLARSGDGGFFAGGYISGRIMKFASDGSPDSTFNTNVIGVINAVVRAIAVKCDGSSLVGGDFTNRLKMFNADGTTTGVAATFNTNVGSSLDNRVYEISLTSDGSVMVGGDFTNRMKMFNPDGTTTGTAATFNTNMGSISGRAVAIALLSDGSVVVGSESSPYLKKLNADGTGDVSFNSNVTGVVNYDVNTISLANDGSMIISGAFTDKVKKLNADGTNATGDAATFNAGITAQSGAQVNQDVESSLLMSDGGVIVVGVSNVNNGSRPTVAKFLGAGFPAATVPSGGSCVSAGGSGGGSGSESSSDSTPSTPVVRAPAVLGPVPLGTSTLPIGGVTPGSSVLLVNGLPQSVTVRPDAPVTSQAKGLVATGDGFTLKLAGVDDRGQSLGLNNDAALILRRDNSALVEGTGFAPNNDVQVYIFSQPRLLGTISTNSTGSFSGLVPVPADLAIGPHTMQINAFNTDGTVRSLSLGVVLQAPKVAANQKTARASVVFDAGSARLSPQAKKALTTLARRAGATATGGMVVGYVQRDRNYASDEQLSIQRAKSVAKFLRLRGVKGTLVTRGNGALSGSETARKAVVTVRYTV